MPQARSRDSRTAAAVVSKAGTAHYLQFECWPFKPGDTMLVHAASGGWTIGSGGPGPISLRLKEELIGIQYGHRPDPFGWVYKVA